MIWYIWLALGIALLVFLILLRLWLNGPKCKKSKSLNGKFIIITGCTSGIGKETALDLLQKGANLILACRDEKKASEMIVSLNPEQKIRANFMQLDLSSYGSTIEFCKVFKEKYSGKKIDFLILNAGMMSKNFQLTENKVEITLQTNLLSYMLIIASLIENMNFDSRIINIGSELHFKAKIDYDFIENDMRFELLNTKYDILKVYGESKLGIIFFSKNLVKYCKDNSKYIKNFVLHPGSVFTGIISTFFDGFFLKLVYFIFYPIFWYSMKTSRMGAQTTLFLCYSEKDDIGNGCYYENCEIQKSSDDSYNEIDQVRFLKYCLNLLENNEISREFIKDLDYFKYLRNL